MIDRSFTTSTPVAVLLVALVVISAFAPLAAAAPSGMTTVPDSNITQDIPDGETVPVSASDLEGSVLASSGQADTMEVIVTTPEHADEVMGTDSNVIGGGEMAIVFSDSVDHESREVAVDAGLLREALGFSPEMIRGTHSSGETWRSKAVYEDGYLSMQIESWSSNTVTFSGEVSVSGSYTDGSTVNYDVSSVDAVSNFSINITGSTATEWDNETASGLSPSGSTSISIAGNTDPSGSSTNGDPTLEMSERPDLDYNPSDDENPTGGKLIYNYVGDHGSDTSVSTEWRIDATETTRINQITPFTSNAEGSDYGFTVEVRIVQENPDGNYGEGTVVNSSWDPEFKTGNQTIHFDQSYQVEAGKSYTIELISDSTDNDQNSDGLEMEAISGASSTWLNTNSVGDRDYYADVHVDPAKTVSGVSVSDGEGLSKSLGDFSDGESKTVEFPVSTSSSTLDFSGSGNGSLSATLHVQERTRMVDPTLSVNGHTTGYTGTLADGTTASLTANESWVEGTNTVNVSVGDGTLSADAPTLAVDLNYSHDAQDKQSVNYTANKWSEKYNVSRTYADATSNAQLTIPHAGNVVAIHSVETQINGDGWSSTSDWNRDGTTLTVNVGDVNSGDKVQVRTVARRVAVAGGSITVLEPTVMGNHLDTKIRLDTWDDGDHIGLGGSPDGRTIHYTYNEDLGGSEYVRIESSGVQQLYLPAAADGAEMRVSTIPVQADVKSGAARFEVRDPSSTQPQFRVDPGSTSGDTVEYTFVDAADDQKYVLYSKTQGVVRDSGTANSPLTLTDDDSEETLQFQEEDEGTGGTAEPQQILGPVEPEGDGPLNSGPAILIGYVVALILLYIVDRGGTFTLPNPVPSVVPVVGSPSVRVPLPGSRGPLFWGGSMLSTLIVLEILSSGLISRTIYRTVTQLSAPLGQVVPLAGIVAVGLAGYYLYRRFILGSGGGGSSETNLVIQAQGGDDEQ